MKLKIQNANDLVFKKVYKSSRLFYAHESFCGLSTLFEQPSVVSNFRLLFQIFALESCAHDILCKTTKKSAWGQLKILMLHM